MKIDFTILLIWSIAVVFLCVNAVLDYRNTKKRKEIIAGLEEELERAKTGSVLDCLLLKPNTIAECRQVLKELNRAIFYLTFRVHEEGLRKQLLELCVHKRDLTLLLMKETLNSIGTTKSEEWRLKNTMQPKEANCEGCGKSLTENKKHFISVYKPPTAGKTGGQQFIACSRECFEKITNDNKI